MSVAYYGGINIPQYNAVASIMLQLSVFIRSYFANILVQSQIGC